MAYKEEALELIAESKNILTEIKIAYEESLHDQQIKPRLLIKIKNFMENLRSALDFTAHHLYNKYGIPTSGNPNIYFPYAWIGLDLEGFTTKNLIQNKIPGLIQNRPDIAADIESYQHFANLDNSWLPKFMELNNENKHQRLSPQTRKEIKQLNIKSGNGGALISLGGGASISLGKGAFIQIGDTIIPGDQTFDVNNPPLTFGGNKEIITWVSFEFTDLNEPAYPLLYSALKGCEKIVTELTNK
ncbi:hypothetical protein ACR777_06435 [Sphingobacterium spiritivorum]|uniref:hypothetical protein n=1 Tax=Sphingobacterium spiritivorum TaxID=258 RepID=UPI003DA452DA